MVFFSPLFAVQPLHEQANSCNEITQPEEHLRIIIKETYFTQWNKRHYLQITSHINSTERENKQTVLTS